MGLCRLCLTENESTLNLYTANLAPVVSQWFQIVAKDNVSTVMCTPCWNIILNFHLYCCNVAKAQRDLLSDNIFVKHQTLNASDLQERFAFTTFNSDMEYKLENQAFDPLECKVELDSDASTPADKLDYSERKNKTDEPKTSSYGKQLNCIKKERTSDDLDVRKSSDNENTRKPKYKLENELICLFCTMVCDLCTVNFKSFSDASKHYKEIHSTKGYLICCNQKLFRRFKALEHVQVHLNPDTFRCKICHKTCKSKRTLQNHKDTHKSEDQKAFQCDQCAKKYPRYELLKQHKKQSHSREEDKLFVCDVCQKKFLTKCYLSEHMKYVHNPNASICDYCGKKFKTPYNLNAHRIHVHMAMKTPRLQCKLCGIWINENYLSNHVNRLHNTDTNETCSICSKVLNCKMSLKKHMKSVHGVRKHACSFCDKAFAGSTALREHVAIHTGENLYNCPYCYKTFKSSGNMHSHRKKMHFAEWEQDRGKRLVNGIYQ